MLTGDKKETVENIAKSCHLTQNETVYVDFEKIDNFENDMGKLKNLLNSD